MMKYKKIFSLLLLAILFIPSTLVYASDLGWPVDIETVTSEEKPNVDVQEETITATDTTTNTSNVLSPIDNSTTGIEEKEIFGEEYDLVNRLSKNAGEDSELSMAEKIYSSYSDVVPVVTTDQMVEWILRKGNEIISILQVFAQPFAIIIFIISAAICLIGSLTKGNMTSKGLMGMISSALLYAAVLYAPLLVNVVSGFLAS